MPPIAYFGIESSGLSLVIDLLILFLVVLYGSLVYWTYADARRRIADPMLIACATVASLFPFVGTIVYMILRPPEYLEDVRERELELQAAEAQLHELNYSLCPHCDYRIERDFIRCPSCLRKLKERCVSCSRPLDRAWTICPYCETDVPAAKPTRRSSHRERASVSESTSLGRAGNETQVDPLESELEPSPPSRSRAAERAAVRAPEPATFVEEPSSSHLPESSSLAADADVGGEERSLEPASKQSARSRSSRRPRPTS
jgi:RNA polymerase subunit RPABC4/transcription elongation factor Spt4